MTGQARGNKDLDKSNEGKTRKETEASNMTDVPFNRFSPPLRVEGKREFIIKDDSKVPSLKEGERQ